MGRPLKVASYGSGNISLQEMSDAEVYNSIGYYILKEFASNVGTGSLVSPQAGATNIGSFVDVYRVSPPGTHDGSAGNLGSTAVTAAQLTGTVTETFTRPITWASSSLYEMSDADINTYIIGPTLTAMTNGGLGSYYISTTTPTHVANATWTQVFTIQNYTYSGANSGTTYVWQLTNLPAPATLYPLKWNTGSALREIDQPTIRLLAQRLRNRIISTGVGTYAIQATAPSTGSWAQLGGTYTDIQQQAGNVSYTGSYTGTYSGAYAGDYAGDYNLMYGGSVGGTYTGYYTGYYTGSYTGYYTGYYTGLTVLGSTETVSNASLWVRRG